MEKILYSEDKIKELINILICDLDIDFSGQIDFSDSPYKDDQDFRLLVQELYDISPEEIN